MENKLEYLIKQNKRKREIGNCKTQFSRLLNITIMEGDFLDLEQTALISNKFYTSYKNSISKICERYSSSEKDQVENAIKRICSKLSRKDGYLITKQTEDCGLLRVSIQDVLTKYEEIIDFDRDSLCILTVNEQEAIYIDYYEEYNNDVLIWYYELCYWEVDLP